MKRILSLMLLAMLITGCKFKLTPEEVNRHQEYGGFYIGPHADFLIYSGDEIKEVLIGKLRTLTLEVPIDISGDKTSIRYSQFHLGSTPDAWGVIHQTPRSIDFSGKTAKVSSLGEILTKSVSGPLVSTYRDLTLTRDLVFHLHAANGSNYRGRVYQNSDGIYQLDRNYPFHDSSGLLNNQTANLYIFSSGGIAYSLLFDNKLEKVIAITRHE